MPEEPVVPQSEGVKCLKCGEEWGPQFKPMLTAGVGGYKPTVCPKCSDWKGWAQVQGWVLATGEKLPAHKILCKQCPEGIGILCYCNKGVSHPGHLICFSCKAKAALAKIDPDPTPCKCNRCGNV